MIKRHKLKVNWKHSQFINDVKVCSHPTGFESVVNLKQWNKMQCHEQLSYLLCQQIKYKSKSLISSCTDHVQHRKFWWKWFPSDLTFEFFGSILKCITSRDCFQVIRFIDLSIAIKWRKPGDYSLPLSEKRTVQLKSTHFLENHIV